MQRHSEEVFDVAGASIPLLFIKMDRALERVGGIEPHAQAAAAADMGFPGLQQLQRYSLALPLGQDSHAAQVALLRRFQIPRDGADYLPLLIFSHEQRHGMKPSADVFERRHRVAKRLAGVAVEKVPKSSPQTRLDLL